MATSDLTIDRLKHLLAYDQETGVFTWVNRPHKKAVLINPGERAGHISDDGYRRIYIDKSPHKEHRLAWMYVHGEPSKSILDHINGDRSDNRILNLREATRAINGQNRTVASRANKSGQLGVNMTKRGAYAASIGVTLLSKRLRIYLGTYQTIEEAKAIYDAAKSLLHAGAIVGHRGQEPNNNITSPACP